MAEDYGYPKELTAVAQLGAVVAPEGGRLDGATVRSVVQGDPANLLSQTFFYRTNQGDISDRLAAVPQASGGVLPSVNPFLGAPLATFLYGYLAPDEAHPQLDLIQGPPASGYAPTFAQPDGQISPRTTGAAPSTGAPQSSAASTQYPVIPAQKSSLFPSASAALPTYNVWELRNLTPENDARVTYRKYVGPVFGQGYDGVTVRQDLPGDGLARIHVSAQNGVAELWRTFGIAEDMAYQEGAKLYYPPVAEGQSVAPRPILARGGANTGFQLHFYHSDASAMSAPNGGRTIGYISVRWGANAVTSGGTQVLNYDLQLVPGQAPLLYFYHPHKQEWDEIPLKGATFGPSGRFSVYVHYCGPNLLIGFGTDTAQWNCISPFDLDRNKDFQLLLYPRSPSDAGIALVFAGMTASFAYGPMAFNNYHPRALRQPEDLSSGADLGRYKVSFTAPDRLKTLLSEVTMNAEFQAGRYKQAALTLSGQSTGGNAAIPDAQETTATFNGDCRRDGTDAVAASPELRFKQTSESQNQEDKSVYGEIVWDTTIEGPMFQHIRNSKFSDAGQVERKKLVRPLPWGDLSDQLIGWEVTYRLDGANRSMLSGTARVEIANLALTTRGRQILARLKKHRLAMTLGGGQAEAHEFFQGIVTKCTTRRSGTGTVTTLELQDIATGLLSRIPFKTSLAFPTMKYGRIIECALAMSGLYDWYRLPDSPNLTRSLSQRLGYSPFESSLARQVLMATPRKKILEILTPVLGMMIDTETLPCFFWDSEKDGGVLRLEWRSDPALRDELSFLGEIDASGLRLHPNALETREHGVLVSDFTITTNTDQIHSGLVLYGQDYDSRIQVYDQKFPESYSEANFDLLAASVGDGAEDRAAPHTGFRNTLVDETQQTMLPDKLSLNLYGDKLVPLIRSAYETIQFSCYVTKPLHAAGTFRLKTILPGGQSFGTDYYLYRTVSYRLDVDQGTITADVTGEEFPSIILPNA